MSVRSSNFKPQTPFGFGLQPGGAFPQGQSPIRQAGTQGGNNPFQQAPLGGQPPQVDQLGVFRSQMQSGQINTNLNQPALPYTASKGWSA